MWTTLADRRNICSYCAPTSTRKEGDGDFPTPRHSVSDAIKQFEETGSNDDRERSDRPVWQAYLQSKACTAPHFSITNLKASLVKNGMPFPRVISK
uniref:Uncharacterized protein n=1 Tax=Ditylenchus dipsaci TaxID=166011 RepID=A0A915EHT1_9BILA